MIKRVTLLAVIVICLLIPLHCFAGRWEKNTNYDYGVSIETPADWNINCDTRDLGSMIKLIEGGNNSFYYMFSISKVDTAATSLLDFTPEQRNIFLRNSISDLRKNITYDVDLVWSDFVERENYYAGQVVFKPSNPQNSHIRITYEMFYHKNKVCNLMYLVDLRGAVNLYGKDFYNQVAIINDSLNLW